MPIKILLIEDEPDIRMITSFRLKKAGYEICCATDGQEGVDMAKSEKPDFIFLDLGLPVIPGGEVCKRLKGDDETKAIPIVILSASSDSIKKTAEEAGADDFLLKPYEPEDLIKKIEKYIK